MFNFWMIDLVYNSSPVPTHHNSQLFSYSESNSINASHKLEIPLALTYLPTNKNTFG